VWAADITYVPIGRGFLYVVAIMDWAGQAVLAESVEHDGQLVLRRGAGRGLGALRVPEIFNTDQGSQSTSAAFTGFSPPPACASRWTTADGGWTTCSSSGCGAR
jgi:putative transposase